MNGKMEQETRWPKIASGVIPLAAFLLGFPLAYKMLLAYVSPGLAFILIAAVMMVLFGVVTPLFAAQHKSIQPADNESKNGPILQFLSVVAFLGLMLCWGALAYIETNALTQPDHATGAYTIAVHLKGVVRFMTPEQYWIDQIAKWIFGGGILGLFSIVLTVKFWRQWRDRGI